MIRDVDMPDPSRIRGKPRGRIDPVRCGVKRVDKQRDPIPPEGILQFDRLVEA